MRKWVASVLMLFILFISQTIHAGDAMPQTRQEIIQLEGMDEVVATTYIESAKGYSIWIDMDYLVPQPEDEGAAMDVYGSPQSDPQFKCELVIYQSGIYDYSFEQAVEDTRQMLMENYGNADMLENVDIFTNLHASGFYSIASGNTILYYLVETETEVFHIVITCPHEAVEGFASRVIWMLKSFEIHRER